MPLSSFIEYIKTMSAYRTLVAIKQKDPLPGLQADFLKCLSSSDPEHIIEVEYTFFSVSYIKNS